MLRKIGSWWGSIKKYVRSVQDQVSDLTNVEIDDQDYPKNTKNEEIKKDEQSEQ